MQHKLFAEPSFVLRDVLERSNFDCSCFEWCDNHVPHQVGVVPHTRIVSSIMSFRTVTLSSAPSINCFSHCRDMPRTLSDLFFSKYGRRSLISCRSSLFFHSAKICMSSHPPFSVRDTPRIALISGSAIQPSTSLTLANWAPATYSSFALHLVVIICFKTLQPLRFFCSNWKHRWWTRPSAPGVSDQHSKHRCLVHRLFAVFTKYVWFAHRMLSYTEEGVRTSFVPSWRRCPHVPIFCWSSNHTCHSFVPR